MVWKTRKRIRKMIQNASEKFKAPLMPLENFSPALSKVFHLPKFAPNKNKSTARICRGGHANRDVL